MNARDMNHARELELIDRNAAIEAVKHDLEWLGSRDGPAAVSALMRLPVFIVRYDERAVQPKPERDMDEEAWNE